MQSLIHGKWFSQVDWKLRNLYGLLMAYCMDLVTKLIFCNFCHISDAKLLVYKHFANY